MDLTGIDYVGFNLVMRRGTAEILERSDDVLLLFETISKAYFAACDDTRRGIEVLDRYLNKTPELLMTPNCDLGEAAYERYGFHEKMVCYHAVYYGEAPALDDRLDVRQATEADLPLIMANYDLISTEEMQGDIQRGSVYINEGFIPYGQIIVGNNASLNLQKKLGLTISDNKVMWLW